MSNDSKFQKPLNNCIISKLASRLFPCEQSKPNTSERLLKIKARINTVETQCNKGEYTCDH